MLWVPPAWLLQDTKSDSCPPVSHFALAQGLRRCIGVFNKRPVKNSMPQASGLGKWSCFQPEHSPVKEREPCLSANSSTQRKDKLISDVTFTYFFFQWILRCIPGSEPRVMSSSNSFIITQGSNSSEHALRNKQRLASARYLTEWCKHLLSLQIKSGVGADSIFGQIESAISQEVWPCDLCLCSVKPWLMCWAAGQLSGRKMWQIVTC